MKRVWMAAMFVLVHRAHAVRNARNQE